MRAHIENETSGPAAQPLSLGVPDGAGGTIVVWAQPGGGPSVGLYVQRVSAAGVPQWSAEGVALGTSTSNEPSPQIASDGAGGAIVTWQDSGGGPDNHIFAQRVSASGVSQWTAGGVALCTAAGGQHDPQIASDGAGGAIVTWQDERAGAASDIYAQRVNAAGAPQWTVDGVALCTATGSQYEVQIASDGSGGAVVTWADDRGGVNTDIYAQRVSAAGAPLWTADGVALCTTATDQIGPRILSDGAGGAIVTWEDSAGGVSLDIYAQHVDAAGAPQWTANGVAVSTASGDQVGPQIVPDGAGGAIVTWQDSRAGGNFDIYAQRVSAAGAPLWTANGAVICAAAHDQYGPQMVPDGAGGAIVTWEDTRGGASYDIYAQRVSAAGAPEWIADGVALCTTLGDQAFPQMVSDDAGGAIVAWQDQRSTDIDLYAQRVSGNGVPQWTADGVAVHVNPGVQRFPASCSDGTGGVFISWQEKRGNYDIYLRRFDSAGSALWPAVAVSAASQAQLHPAIVPDGSGGGIVTWEDDRGGVDADIYAQRVSSAGAPQWTANGVALCSAGGSQSYPQAVSDGAGGAIVTWEDDRSDVNIYAQHVSAAGVPQWTPNGVALCTAASRQYNPQIVSDGAGGAIVTWLDYRGGAFDIYAQHVSAAGTLQWTAGGVAVCTAAGDQYGSQIVSDGAGGAIVTWFDERDVFTTHVYAQRVNAAGAPQWTANGVALCTAAGGQYNPQIASDEAGGAIVAWEDLRGVGADDLYVQRVSGAGAAQWTPDGVALCTATGGQHYPQVASDGAGGAIVAWDDGRGGTTNDIYARRVNAAGAPQWTADGVAVCTAPDNQWVVRIVPDGGGGAMMAWADHRDGIQDFIYAQRVTADGSLPWQSGGITPVLVSLVGAEAQPNRVRITWYAAEAAGLNATVYRETGRGGWTALGRPLPDGTGRLTYEDRDVIPGERYGYRLGLLEAGAEQFSAETWVEVPRGGELALMGARPNPAVDGLWVWFALPSDAPATLRLFDLAGRQVREREVAGAGTRAVDLGEGNRLPAGVYVVRLTQGARSLTQRVAVMR